MLQWSGEDILDNAQFDLVIATAIGLGLAFDRAGETAFGRRYGETRGARGRYCWSWWRGWSRPCASSRRWCCSIPAYRAQYYANAEVVRAGCGADRAGFRGRSRATTRWFAGLPASRSAYDDFRAEMLVATGASRGLDEQGLMRAHGLTYVAQ